MNYDHAYHAGNFADVLKHAFLTLCLQHLKNKEKPFFFLDTHGGQGSFDLTDGRAERTGEAKEGIERVLARAATAPAPLLPYLDAIRALGAVDAEGSLLRYPGSPLLARHLMRPGDRLVAAELHPDHAARLSETLRRRADTRVEHRDGYEALKALLPPPERRGMVLIDPPFEKTDEFRTLARALRAATRRWAAGTYLVWYPVKDAAAVEAFHGELRAELEAPTLVADLWARPRFPPLRLNGTGLVVINPPHGLLTALPTLLPWLSETLAEPGAEGASWRWLIEERGGA